MVNYHNDHGIQDYESFILKHFLTLKRDDDTSSPLVRSSSGEMFDNSKLIPSASIEKSYIIPNICTVRCELCLISEKLLVESNPGTTR